MVFNDLTSCPAWGPKVWLWHWRNGSAAKLLKTQVHSCPNSSRLCLARPRSTMSAALTYIKLWPGPDQQPGSVLLFLAANYKHLPNPLLPFSVSSSLGAVLVLDHWGRAWPKPQQTPFIYVYDASNYTNTTQVDQTSTTAPQDCGNSEIEISATLSKKYRRCFDLIFIFCFHPILNINSHI